MSVDAAVLLDLARVRRRRRTEDVDIFEKLYQAYLSVITVGLVVLVGASAIGDERVGPAALRTITQDGPAYVGAIVALLLVAGLRSGARGGPLTLEAAFVAHVLLSPVPRDRSLREPAWRQLRQALLVGGGCGALAGVIASHRLPLDAWSLVGFAALAGAVTAISSVGLAMVVAGYPVSKGIVQALSVLVIGASVADVVAGTALSPGSVVGRLALGGIHVDPVGLLVLPIAVAIGLGGVVVVGGTSIEAATRRAGLVSELRFAVTRQDLRTVVLLQRRLAQDAARRRPWVRIPRGDRLPVLRRGLQGLARLPLVRIVRTISLCSIAVAAALGTWRGTSPLVVISGLALWAAALDVIEPLAQELDHPDRWAGYPVAPGDLVLRHLTAPVLALALATAVPVGVLAILSDTSVVLQTAVVVMLPACVAAVLGAAASVATSPFDLSLVQSVAPETIGAQLFVRVAWPPAVAVVATLPLLAARSAADRDLTPSGAAGQYLLPICVMLGLVSVWLSHRKPATI